MITSSYMLRQFKSSRDSDFVNALHMYARSVHPGLKTNTNEITFWIDNYSRRFPDKFYVVGFYSGQRLVGYAEFLYIIEQKLMVFDYLVIDKLFRKNNVFFEFVDHLKHFIETEGLDLNYVVAEVGYLTRTKEPSDYTQLLVRLLKFEGGGVVKAPYYQPKLGLYNHESEMAAALVVFAYDRIEEISRETYLSIVESVYFKYYSRWYSIYEDTAADYVAHLHALFSRIEMETKNMKQIKLNGFKSTFQETPSSETVSETRILWFAVRSLFVVVFLAFLLMKLREVYSLSLFALLLIYLLALLSFFSLMALYSKTALIVFKRLLALFKPFSRKIR
jgi:hypothetical protein